jgi:putative addiction module component (TIGR02574 family)
MDQFLDHPMLLALPAEERLRLIELLWDSLDEVAVPTPNWHEDVLRERLAEHAADPTGNLDWTTALEELKVEIKR